MDVPLRPNRAPLEGQGALALRRLRRQLKNPERGRSSTQTKLTSRHSDLKSFVVSSPCP